MTITDLERRLKDAEQHLESLLKGGKFTHYQNAFDQLASAQRELAAASGEEYAVPTEMGFEPEAAVSGPVLLQTDDRCFLTFNAVRMLPQGKRGNAGTGIVECCGCSITKFGYPNDEALAGHPLYKRGLRGYGVSQVHNSNWSKQLTAQNRVSFPNTADSQKKHFIISFHDSTFECIADELRGDLSNDSYERILERITKEMFLCDNR